MSGLAQRSLLTLSSVCAVLSLFAGAAKADLEHQKSFGSAGTGAGQFSNPASIAVNHASGDVYVVDRNRNRVQQFDAAGNFLRMWGFDVVAGGDDDKPLANEVQEVRIRATGGTFTLTFGASTTTAIPFDASAGEVQAALNALASISSGGGSVTVGGGPGDPTGSTPYVVTFGGGPLAGTNRELEIDPSGLGVPAGTQLRCAAGPGSANAIAYQWLANGDPISGAVSPTYTPGPAEAGKAVQCRVTATFGQAKTIAASRPYALASPAPSPSPPLGPSFLAAPTGSLILESSGGLPVTCNAGSWIRNPESYTYRWYRSGEPIGSPTTTAATSNQYVATQTDLATRAVFQCSVTAHNAGGSSTAFSAIAPTVPKPIEPEAQDATATVSIASSGASKTITRVNGGAVFEVCRANPPSNDVCKTGVNGKSPGQFGIPRSIAVDNSSGGGGDVYVMDDFNPRVQKFGPSGQLIGMFGLAVNQTTDGDVCTVASGDACGVGIRDTEATPGAFGSFPLAGSFAELGNELAVDSAGNVYVADPRVDQDPVKPRIQKFDSSGAFLAQAKVPGRFGTNTGTQKPVSIAVDGSQRVFASIGGEAAVVERFSPAEFSPDGNGADRTGNLLHEDAHPSGLAVDPGSDRLLVADRNTSDSVSYCGGPAVSVRAIAEYDSAGRQVDCSVPGGAGGLPQATGMAASPSGLLYVAVGSLNAIRIFKLPQSAPPQLGDQSATNITSESAQVRAQINPGFEETDFEVEYGPADCSVNACAVAPGGELHGLKYVEGSASLAGLSPNTKYHYRVIAESKLGKVTGPDRTFVTFPLVDLVNDPCPNALARKQTKTVGLLDCRAYELASAGFTGGYDVESNLVPGQAPFDAFPDASGKVLYAVHEGGIPGTGNPTNRGPDPYVASRGPDGWQTEYVGIPANGGFSKAPFSSTLAGTDETLDTFAFAGPEICSPCFADGSSGAPVRLPDGSLVQGMTGSIPQLSAKPTGHVAKPLSADGGHFVFGSTAKFEPAGKSGEVSIYDRDLNSGTTQVVSTLPNGSTMSGQVGQLDVSADGSRIVVAQKISTDTAGNSYWHPYMHVGTSPNTVDLAPGITTGVLYNGMSADGSKLFFTTKDKLLAADTDASADIYGAKVDGAGSLALGLVTTKGGNPSNDDSCAPPGIPDTWNSASGDGKCGAVAFAGGAGVASGDGTFYFLSPELLDGPSQGAPGQPNLFVVRPGEELRFVATIDSSTVKPPPPPPEHPLVDQQFGGEVEDAQALTVDQSNGDVYAVQPSLGIVSRFKSNGAPRNFTAGPDANTNTLKGFTFGAASAAQVAIDNAPGSPLGGNVYVASEDGIGIFAPSGESLGSLNGAGTGIGTFGDACGVAVDQSTGAVYVGDRAGYMWRYSPTAPTPPLADADYTITGIATQAMEPCAVAADSAGRIYASQSFNGPVKRFSAAAFTAGSPPPSAGIEIDASARALATDPETDELYVDEGTQIAVFDSSGNAVTTIGAGKLACGVLGSRGVAVNAESHHVYASCELRIKEFGYQVPPNAPIDNPAVLHAVQQAGTHSYGDFQVTPDGRYAIFATVMPLDPGYDNAGRVEVYRFDALSDELDCVSCISTEAQPVSDASLPGNGLGVLEDGRVFFNSSEQLTLRDTNGKQDAYEWSDGAAQLISTGTSAHPSGLLGITADGVDAFFFTREVLVPGDQNGEAMKIYDAREKGGFFVIPPSPPCAASDECHGPGTKAPPPPPILTAQDTGVRRGPSTCKKGFVKRHGKCVKKKRRPGNDKRRAANRRRGGTR